MKLRKPDYYDRFQCIAGACSDSCCIGWEIDVDKEQREKYRHVTGELGERLTKYIDWEEGHFILQGKEERCPFLNQENLCDLIIGLGEESLCEICREHPRFYEWYDDLTEVGVGLCCEAAARLILEREEPCGFVETEESEETSDIEDEHAEIVHMLMKARETAFLILQNRTQSVWQRLKLFLLYVEELQDALDFESFDEIMESAEYYRDVICEMNDATVQVKVSAFESILDLCEKLEPIDESWPARLKQIHGHLQDVKTFCKAEEQMSAELQGRDYEYEHLAVYFVYRYFMKCRIDRDIYSRGCLTVFCIMLVHLLDIATYIETGNLTIEDRVQNAKDCSKEIEYSEENLALLAELFWDEGFETIAGYL